MPEFVVKFSDSDLWAARGEDIHVWLLKYMNHPADLEVLEVRESARPSRHVNGCGKASTRREFYTEWEPVND